MINKIKLLEFYNVMQIIEGFKMFLSVLGIYYNLLLINVSI